MLNDVSDEQIKNVVDELCRIFKRDSRVNKGDIVYSVSMNGLDLKKNKKFINHLVYIERKEKKLVNSASESHISEYLPFVDLTNKKNKKLLKKEDYDNM